MQRKTLDNVMAGVLIFIAFVFVAASIVMLVSKAWGDTLQQPLKLQIPFQRVVYVKQSIFSKPDKYVMKCEVTNSGREPREVEGIAQVFEQKGEDSKPVSDLHVEPKSVRIEPGDTKAFYVTIPARWGEGVLCGFSYKPIVVGQVTGERDIGLAFSQGFLFGINFGMPEDPQVTFTAVQREDHVETTVSNGSPWVLQCTVDLDLTGEKNALSFLVGPHNVRTIRFDGVHAVAILDVRGLGKRLGVKLGTRTTKSIRNPVMETLVSAGVSEHEGTGVE